MLTLFEASSSTKGTAKLEASKNKIEAIKKQMESLRHNLGETSSKRSPLRRSSAKREKAKTSDPPRRSNSFGSTADLYKSAAYAANDGVENLKRSDDPAPKGTST